MTDPESADSIYIEPINWRTIERIIEKERPSALLPTMGGQTALNTALDLVREGVLEKFNVEMIGASQRAIDMAEDRELFRKAMTDIGLECARSRIAHSMEEALAVQAEIGFPTVIRPSFTLGGSGGGIAYNREEFETIVARGLDASPTNEVLLEESVLGWKEYEMEVVRDRNDNCIIVCSIENLDPMGVHTGDSITVAPAQTLSDREYQRLRDASIAVLRKIGVDTGGSNVQFAVNPDDGRVLVIEMNPRVSRSSALASKATGFPIAKIAAKLAVGYTLDELKNEITGGEHAGIVRAHHRLCGHEDPALHVREIPGREHAPHHPDEIGGRGHGDRPLVPGIDAQGLAQPRARLRRVRRAADAAPDRRGVGEAVLRAALARSGAHPVRRRRVPRRLDVAADLRGDQDRSVVSVADRGLGARGGAAPEPRLRQPRARPVAHAQAQGIFRCAHRRARVARGARGAQPAAQARPASGVQARRHLRRGVLDLDRLPVLDLRRGVRGESERAPQDHDPGRRPQPHRPGHRVRLLLRARGHGAARGRVRDHHGQLQPRDGLDRLRHLRPAVLRAPDASRT